MAIERDQVWRSRFDLEFQGNSKKFSGCDGDSDIEVAVEAAV